MKKAKLVSAFILAILIVITPHLEVFSAPIAPTGLKPYSIIIPAASVYAAVRPMGLTKTNKIDVPNNLIDAGWYAPGIIPGNTGVAIFDGHVDNGADMPGVFKHLRDVRKGDDIYVSMNDGRRLHFVVRSRDVYDYRATTAGILSVKDAAYGGNASYVAIITCHGAWLPREKTYDERLVVTAVLVS